MGRRAPRGRKVRRGVGPRIRSSRQQATGKPHRSGAQYIPAIWRGWPPDVQPGAWMETCAMPNLTDTGRRDWAPTTGVLSVNEGCRDRNAAPANRIVFLEAALQCARSENAWIRRREAALRGELERVHAENARLRATVLDARQPVGAAQLGSCGAREMTAGTIMGPRRRPGSAPRPPRAVSSA
jgi:hypothetical protein